MTDSVTLADRYAGCLLGLACGDALGGPVEFRSRDEIARDFPGGLRDFVGGGWLGLAPGEVTDDTQQTLILGRALNGGDFDVDRFVAELLAWYAAGPKDVGDTTRAALDRLAAGVPWQEAGESALRQLGRGHAAGNGAVMRCAPVALRFRREPAALVRASLDSARVTHAHPRSAWGAVAVNQAIAHLLGGGSREIVSHAAVAGIDEPAVHDAVLGAAELGREQVRAGGHVLETLGAAFWALLRHDSLEETLVAAVGFGEDADTTGAVVGALAGAHYGAAAIPRRWLERVQHRDALVSLANRLLGLVGD